MYGRDRSKTPGAVIVQTLVIYSTVAWVTVAVWLITPKATTHSKIPSDHTIIGKTRLHRHNAVGNRFMILRRDFKTSQACLQRPVRVAR